MGAQDDLDNAAMRLPWDDPKFRTAERIAYIKDAAKLALKKNPRNERARRLLHALAHQPKDKS